MLGLYLQTKLVLLSYNIYYYIFCLVIYNKLSVKCCIDLYVFVNLYQKSVPPIQQ